MQHFIQAQWQKRGLWAWLMSPLGFLVCGIARLKRFTYQHRWRQQTQISVPLIVVGNISVGGTGKTPMVAYIASCLSKAAYRPGIISRGYKGRATHWPQVVTPQSDPYQVGDEPVMLARQTLCPIIVGPNRIDSARHLLASTDCNVIISDDGFSHLKLARDIDIVVIDQKRGFGNGWCLPAGPLREGQGALLSADMQVIHTLAPLATASQNSYAMQLVAGDIYNLNDSTTVDIMTLCDKPIHAIAGIGHPKRFFDVLRAMGLNIIEHAFADHHTYTPSDLIFNDGYDLITTEKDAVKLAQIQQNKTIWVLPVKAELDHNFSDSLLLKLQSLSLSLSSAT